MRQPSELACDALRLRAWQRRWEQEQGAPQQGSLTRLCTDARTAVLDALTEKKGKVVEAALEALTLLIQGTSGMDTWLLATVEDLYRTSVVEYPEAYGPGSTVRSCCRQLLLALDTLADARLDALIAALKALPLPRYGTDGEEWAAYERALARLRGDRAWLSAGPSTSQAPHSEVEKDYFWNRYQLDRKNLRVTLPEAGQSGRVKGDPAGLLLALEKLITLASFDSQSCGEFLWQESGTPRRYPLARYIRKKLPTHFQFIAIDEAHEYNTKESAQAHAAHRLSGLKATKVLLTGSLMGGYSSSLFSNLQAFSDRFRREFPREGKATFVNTYGYRKFLVARGDLKDTATTTKKVGAVTDRAEEYDWQERRLGEAPGILPVFLPRHLLPIAVFVHKGDLDEQLPPYLETRSPIRVERTDQEGRALLAEVQRIQSRLMERIMDDLGTDRAGKLMGAMCQLPSYLDLCTEDTGNGVDEAGRRVWRLAYPEDCGSQVVVSGHLFPASWRTPKERWLIARVRAMLTAGHTVMVAVEHTGNSNLVGRLMRLVREELGVQAVYLDTAKVNTRIRQDWIDRTVITPKAQVLFLNAAAAATGLNNLVYFDQIIWYETTLSAYTFTQFCGRIHRIGQKRAVEVDKAFYAETAQEAHTRLIEAKVKAANEVDGQDLQAALEAAGASEEDQAQARYLTSQSLGNALFQTLLAAQSSPFPALPTPGSSETDRCAG